MLVLVLDACSPKCKPGETNSLHQPQQQSPSKQLKLKSLNKTGSADLCNARPATSHILNQSHYPHLHHPPHLLSLDQIYLKVLLPYISVSTSFTYPPFTSLPPCIRDSTTSILWSDIIFTMRSSSVHVCDTISCVVLYQSYHFQSSSFLIIFLFLFFLQ
ncbi:hypothetical protein E2C01_069368 [Portunus trituberculatus]|uniref:Uncharacterized protein n=1 Tax=Portunus trituberculatus TaxID=210409 RepID=A0A5B7HYQ4_PORTR|nr:hypothetical protein [Portunus trituberculatus]